LPANVNENKSGDNHVHASIDFRTNKSHNIGTIDEFQKGLVPFETDVFENHVGRVRVRLAQVAQFGYF
jgi:hypothetical protein